MKKLLVYLSILSFTYADSFLANFQNDFINNTDRHLTSAVEFSYVKDSKDTEYNYMGFSLFHDIYTPENISSRDKKDFDIPYAGHVYTNIYWHYIRKNYLHSVGFSLGHVGEYSYAKQLQKYVHKVMPAHGPKGWEHQLGNKTTYSGIYKLTQKLKRDILNLDDIDINNNLKLEYGNFSREVSISSLFRYGKNYPQNYRTVNDNHITQIGLSKKDGWSVSVGFDVTYFDYIYVLDEFKDEYPINRDKLSFGNMIAFDIYMKSHNFNIAVKETNISLNEDTVKERWFGASYIYIF